MEEWISSNEYMKRNKIGYKAMKHLIATKQVETMDTGGHIKIKVGGDTVSRKIYEQEKEKRIQAETTLEMLKTLLVERSK